MGRGFVKHRPVREPDLATEAQVEAMNAKLKARLKRVSEPCAQPLQAGQSPPGEIPSGKNDAYKRGDAPKEKSGAKLEWERPVTGATGVKTKCGRYACAKVTVMGITFYELSKLVPGQWFYVLHTRLDNFMQAQVLAQQDADK